MRIFDLPSLFAGKLHALLCRDYLKGRDWYDFIWYTARQIPMNKILMLAALDQQGSRKGQGPKTNNAWCVEQLSVRIADLDRMQVQLDVQRFVRPHELPSLELWTNEFFLQQTAKLSHLRSLE